MHFCAVYRRDLKAKTPGIVREYVIECEFGTFACKAAATPRSGQLIRVTAMLNVAAYVDGTPFGLPPEAMVERSTMKVNLAKIFRVKT